MDHFDEFSQEFQYAFIAALGLNRVMETLPFLEKKDRYQDSEVRIRSLKEIKMRE